MHANQHMCNSMGSELTLCAPMSAHTAFCMHANQRMCNSMGSELTLCAPIPSISLYFNTIFLSHYMWAHVFTHTHCTIRIAVIISTRKITFLVLMAGLFVKSNERTYMKLLPEVCLGLKAQSHIPLRTSNAQKMKNFGQCVVIRWACVRIRR